MKAKEGFKVRKLCNEFILTAEGMGQVNFNKMISLNATAEYLWSSIQGKEFTPEDLKNLLLEKYEVDEQTAAKDAEAIAAAWIEAGIAEQ